MGFKWDNFQEDEVEDTDTAADEVPSVNGDDEDAFQGWSERGSGQTQQRVVSVVSPPQWHWGRILWSF